MIKNKKQIEQLTNTNNLLKSEYEKLQEEIQCIENEHSEMNIVLDDKRQ